MFSDEIVISDAFLDMPSGSQLLYFHLGIQADDDGFVSSPKMVMRIIGSSEDELKILMAKKFLIQFPNGICVIKHWRINNQLRKDRYTETKYVDEKNTLFIRENGAYTLNPENALPIPKGHFTAEDIASGNQLATTRQPSIGKVSIGKESGVKKATGFIKPTLEEVTAYCTERANKVNPQQWLDHYSSNGWKVGRNQMKDWRAAVRTWERSQYNNPEPKEQKATIHL